MPANATESTEARTSPSPATEPKSGRGGAEGKPAGTKGPATRRRRGHDESPKTAGEERFFLAGTNRNGDVPALGRECASEADAIIDAFSRKGELLQNFGVSNPCGCWSVRGTGLKEGSVEEE